MTLARMRSSRPMGRRSRRVRTRASDRRGGARSRAGCVVKGKGVNLRVAALPLVPPVTAQLVAGDGATTDGHPNDAPQLKAKGA